MGSCRVMVQVIGTSRGSDGETDHTEVTVPGIYSCQNGKHFILYEEDDGEGCIVRNTVKIAEDSFEVIKKGSGSAHMVFRAGERARSWYETPYGRFSLVLCVKEVEIHLAAIGGAGAGGADVDGVGAGGADVDGVGAGGAGVDRAGAGAPDVGKSADAGEIMVRAAYTVELDGAAVSENEVSLKIYGADRGRD